MIKSLIRSVFPERLLIHGEAFDHYLHGEKEIRLLSVLCDKTRMSLDIGANIGIYTYFMRKYSRKVYAYEPNPVLAQRLRRLFPDVVVRQAAVSDVTGETVLEIPVEDGRVQHELASIAQGFAPSMEIEKHIVPSLRIDDEELDAVGFIKIDVERHEIAVIKGCINTIKTCRPIFMTEVAPLLYPHPLPEMFKFVTDLGYEGWFRFESKYYPLTEFSVQVHANPDKWGYKFMANNMIFLPDHTDSWFLQG